MSGSKLVTVLGALTTMAALATPLIAGHLDALHVSSATMAAFGGLFMALGRALGAKS